jgi:anti-sigma-K factor RskA
VTDEDEEEEQTSLELQAAEYVLGTLDEPERQAARRLIESDPAFTTLVLQWERRLGELDALADGVDPPVAVWEAIKAKLPDLPQAAPFRLPELPALPAANLATRMARFRMATAASGALAAVLALIIVLAVVAPNTLPAALRPKPRPIATAEGALAPRYIAVLQPDAAPPAFMLTVDLASRSLTVRRVSADSATGSSYELWLVSDKFPAPRSLGLLSSDGFTRSDSLTPYDPETIAHASFAVSLEPEGGSPNGAPSNVMFEGKLIEATPGPAPPL